MLQAFFKEEHSKGRSYADLYELVQHAGNVLPRLCATMSQSLVLLLGSTQSCSPDGQL
jgi:hypothetical protein